MKRAITFTMAALMLLTGISVYATGSSVAVTPTEPIVIDWLAYNCYRHPEPDALVIKKMEEKYGVKFNIWFIDEKNWDDALGVRLAAGEMPDYFRIKNSGIVGKYVEQGILAPVTDEMFKQIPNYVKLIDEYDTDKNIYMDVMIDGKIYALKVINITGSYPTILVWRTDWLRNVGITKMPETIAEFEDAMYKMAKNDPDKNGKNDTYGLSSTAIGVVFGAYGMMPLKQVQKGGLHWTTKNGKLVFSAIQPEMKEPLAMLQKWYKDGVIDPEFITGENKGGYWALSHAFMNGRIGLTGLVMATHWNPPLLEGHNPAVCLAEFIKVNPDAVYGETVEIGKPPVGPTGKSGAHQWGYAGESTGFTTKCVANKEKTDIILKLIYNRKWCHQGCS
jgi:putative aldouronate transport system substrate-binding protein